MNRRDFLHTLFGMCIAGPAFVAGLFYGDWEKGSVKPDPHPVNDYQDDRGIAKKLQAAIGQYDIILVKSHKIYGLYEDAILWRGQTARRGKYMQFTFVWDEDEDSLVKAVANELVQSYGLYEGDIFEDI